METRVFAFVIGNLQPSQLNSVIEAACCDLVSDNTACKFSKIQLLENRKTKGVKKLTSWSQIFIAKESWSQICEIVFQ
jgi:hypothetical protein